jgi:hypothetical protein
MSQTVCIEQYLGVAGPEPSLAHDWGTDTCRARDGLTGQAAAWTARSGGAVTRELIGKSPGDSGEFGATTVPSASEVLETCSVRQPHSRRHSLPVLCR